jgi:prepilin-type N-terminal cleavage/methylation domain-containing protein
MDRTKPMQNKNKGFTLIELAVVVAVVTLLLGTLLVPLTTQVAQRNIIQTQKQLDEIREAVLGYAIVNGRLPRPATSETDGNERAACADARDCTGFLPWATLGLPRADAWGKLLRYSVVPQYANATFDFGTSATLKTVQTRIPSSSTPVNLATNLVAVVISYGPNNWGRTEAGTDIVDTSATNVDEDTNEAKFHCTTAANCTDFISRPMSTSPAAAGGEFDDLLVWVPQTILFNRLVAAGKLP